MPVAERCHRDGKGGLSPYAINRTGAASTALAASGGSSERVVLPRRNSVAVSLRCSPTTTNVGQYRDKKSYVASAAVVESLLRDCRNTT